MFLIFHAYPAKEVAGGDMETMGILIGAHRRFVAYTADETAAFHNDIHIRRHQQLHATTKGVDVYLLILCNSGLAQVHTDAATESVEAGAMERLAMKDILVAAVAGRADKPSAFFTDGQRSFQPLVRVVLVTADNKFYTYIYYKSHGEVRCPRLSPQPLQMYDVPQVGQFQEAGDNKDDSKNSSSFHHDIYNLTIYNLLFIFQFLIFCDFCDLTLQRYAIVEHPPNFWDIMLVSVTNGVRCGMKWQKSDER